MREPTARAGEVKRPAAAKPGPTGGDATTAQGVDPVIAYYEAKTASILTKYGPGPRVHFHVGFAEGVPVGAQSVESLRALLRSSQERVLVESAEAWGGASVLSGDLLDVGCGLGGGAIHWAESFGARVTALTNVSAHRPWVEGFATEAGVADRLHVVVGDACALDGPPRFDVAVAIDSSSYLPREAWFGALQRALRPEGRLLLVDGFLVDRRIKPRLDAYWRTDLGTVAEYEGAGREHGFTLEKAEALSGRVVGFWALSLAWIRAQRARPGGSAAARTRLERSERAHLGVLRDYARGAVAHLRLSFRLA